MGQIRKYLAHKEAVNAGAYDKHGNKLGLPDYIKLKDSGGEIYRSKEEALETRTSEGVETKKDNKSVFGSKRANLFGN
jgi:hypothetical protein